MYDSREIIWHQRHEQRLCEVPNRSHRRMWLRFEKDAFLTHMVNHLKPMYSNINPVETSGIFIGGKSICMPYSSVHFPQGMIWIPKESIPIERVAPHLLHYWSGTIQGINVHTFAATLYIYIYYGIRISLYCLACRIWAFTNNDGSERPPKNWQNQKLSAISWIVWSGGGDYSSGEICINKFWNLIISAGKLHRAIQAASNVR